MATSWIKAALCVGAIFGMAVPAFAQEKRDHLGDFRDWSTFRDVRTGGERVCYMISTPKKTEADRDGVSRGAIYIMVSHWPSREIRDQVRISGGYPYEPSSTVTAEIQNKTFELFTSGQDAWAFDAAEDKRLVDAMKAGADMSVEGRSARGTNTTDNFSLAGFTAAYNAITEACS